MDHVGIIIARSVLAHVFLYNQSTVKLKQPVAKRVSNPFGELVAVQMVHEFVPVKADNRDIKKISYVLGSKARVGILSLELERKEHRATVMGFIRFGE